MTVPSTAETSNMANRTIITVCVMVATLMQTLDTTIVNVAMPYMQGSLAASPDQITWVLTSYIVAAAIMTPPVGWLSARFGRKNLFLVSLAGFTLASMLCGTAESLAEIVLFRVNARRVRCGACAFIASHHARHLSARPARPGDGDLGDGRHRGAHHGAYPRRLSDRLLQLALGVLHQPAVRHPRDCRALGFPAATPAARADCTST